MYRDSTQYAPHCSCVVYILYLSWRRRLSLCETFFLCHHHHPPRESYIGECVWCRWRKFFYDTDSKLNIQWLMRICTIAKIPFYIAPIYIYIPFPPTVVVNCLRACFRFSLNNSIYKNTNTNKIRGIFKGNGTTLFDTSTRNTQEEWRKFTLWFGDEMSLVFEQS